MPKFLPGVTHALVVTSTNKEDMDKMHGIMANVNLCFGPGDEHALCSIGIKKMEGPVTGLTAHIPKTARITNGKTTYEPTLTGKLADEAKLLALTAFDRVKQSHGLKFGKRYRVIANAVEEIGA